MMNGSFKFPELTRRHFLGKTGLGVGALALQSLLNPRSIANEISNRAGSVAARAASFAHKAKQVIYLNMVGAPSQLDLFDDKPKLRELDGQKIPEEFLKGQRFAFIRGVPEMYGSPHKFRRHGQSGAELSDVLPHLATVADDIAIVRSLHTEQFN